MSNDPIPLKPGMNKRPPIVAKKLKENTEFDLWDLDIDDSPQDPKKLAKDGVSEPLPSPRTASPYAPTKKPVELLADAPVRAPSDPLEAQAEVTPTPEETISPQAEDAIGGSEWDKAATGKESAPVISAATTHFLASLNKTERIAISALFGVLLLAAVLTAIFFYNKIPTRSPISEKIDFPVSGKFIEIRSVVTYWRKPITTGENADVVRRGVALLPVLSLKLHAKPCAIRVFFRDEAGTVIGDGITRTVSGDMEIEMPGTAGFADPGIHAGYRTGEQKPWTAQVFEGPSATADRKEYRKVLETPISTDLR